MRRDFKKISKFVSCFAEFLNFLVLEAKHLALYINNVYVVENKVQIKYYIQTFFHLANFMSSIIFCFTTIKTNFERFH